MQTSEIYSVLIKPTWAPPAWLFGPVWIFLYIIIGISFTVVFYKVWKKKFPSFVSVPFILNLIFNFSYTYLQFSLRNYFLAAVDVLLILGTLIWAMVIVYKREKWISLVNIPYLLWVSFATILQLTITYLNW